jgi:hypothetical protein
MILCLPLLPGLGRFAGKFRGNLGSARGGNFPLE